MKEAKDLQYTANKMLTALHKITYKATTSNEWQESLFKQQEHNSLRLTCMEKKSCFHKFSAWDFKRMCAVEVDAYGDKLAVSNLKSFVLFRAQEIQKEKY